MPRLVVTVCAYLCLLPGYSLAQQAVTLEQTPVAVRSGRAQLIGHYDPSQMLRVVFALKPPHSQEEEEFLNAVSDPQSYLFHHFLSDAEWNARFAPSVEDEQAVVSWATSQGLRITQRYPNRLLVDVEAPAGVLEKAFNVSLNQYQIGAETYFSNDRDPSLPASIAGKLTTVLGLNNIERAHRFSNLSNNTQRPDYSPGPVYAVGEQIRSDAPHNPAKKLSPSGALPPQYTQVANAIYAAEGYDYGILHAIGHCCNPLNNPHHSPPQSSIAVVGWGDFGREDLNQFVFDNGLAVNVQKYFIGGIPLCCDPEATLDAEWTTIMANSFDTSTDTAEVHMYEGSDAAYTTLISALQKALNDGYARTLSMSWGGSENYDFTPSEMNTFHNLFNQMVGQGWTIVAASGDHGATTDCMDYLAVSYPASDPDITAVGGTKLKFLSSETAWSGGSYGCAQNDGGSGGGCSVHFSAPQYQTHQACASGKRSTPDIALNADWVNSPQEFYFEGSYDYVGGTSIGAPEMAAFFARSNAYLLYLQGMVGNTCGPSGSAPCAPLGNANWYLYSEGNNDSAPHYPFYDVTQGCNDNDITRKYHLSPFCTKPGYDRVTGWGSANMFQLAWMMNTFMAGDGAGPSISVDAPQAWHWYNTDHVVNISITDTSANGHPPTGAVGFSTYWGTDPGDAKSEPHPSKDLNETNSFYIGPTTLAKSGSLTLSSMGANQGCQNLTTRAWDNSGEPSSVVVGPLCYDTYGPSVHDVLSGNFQDGDYIGPVQITLTASDSGSGVASVWYSLNSGPWQHYLFPVNTFSPGAYTMLFYAIDQAGNSGPIGADSWYIWSNTQNTLTVTKSGSGTGAITSLDGSINCGSVCTATTYTGTQFLLMATPASGSVFAGWTGCDHMEGGTCIAAIGTDRTVTASFAQAQALRFVPLAPCRVVDTRLPDGPFGGPAISGGSERDFALPQGSCNIPPQAAAYSLNVTVVPNGYLGYLTVWPTGQTQPGVSTLNSLDGRIKANAAIIPAGTGGAVSVYASDTTQVVLDVNGYFVPSDPSSLAFFPLTPCRVADTRNSDGPLGGPYLAKQQPRDLPLQQGTCNIPSTAQAYSLNFTAIPRNGILGFLTVWPSGQTQPLVSTLNDLTGTIVANAAIVPAGSGGDISVFPSDETDLVVDVNGYFAAPDSGTNPLSLYATWPCRAFDSRQVNGEFSGAEVVNISGSTCAIPPAQGYILNATVIPFGPMGYLSLWPDGGQQPVVSTLNAIDMAVTSNMAIVPTTNGSVDSYIAGTANLVLDISSYFAP